MKLRRDKRLQKKKPSVRSADANWKKKTFTKKMARFFVKTVISKATIKSRHVTPGLSARKRFSGKKPGLRGLKA
ncbi:hypothetical protein ACSAZL_06115 [Methanosarcina sp. T3]|uniref:hypothetical protein n=1 Tax=Methanosarcina sp. T3 TaxID=3439062 RepID=UPI003F82A086